MKLTNLIEIGKLICTQDNRITDQPMFIVQEKKRTYGMDGDYANNYVWVNRDWDNDKADERQAKILDKMEDNFRTIKGWEKVYYKDEWVFVTACFTEKGCQDFLRIDGHNHGETRIYADGSYRNNEFREIRNTLIALYKESIGEQNELNA